MAKKKSNKKQIDKFINEWIYTDTSKQIEELALKKFQNYSLDSINADLENENESEVLTRKVLFEKTEKNLWSLNSNLFENLLKDSEFINNAMIMSITLNTMRKNTKLLF